MIKAVYILETFVGQVDLLSVSSRLPRWLRQADLSLLIRVVERIGDFAQIAA